MDILYGGQLVNFGDYQVEVINRLNDVPCKAVAISASEGGRRVVLIYFGELKKCGIYRYKNFNTNRQYYSTSKDFSELVNNRKYGILFRTAMEAYNQVFGIN